MMYICTSVRNPFRLNYEKMLKNLPFRPIAKEQFQQFIVIIISRRITLSTITAIICVLKSRVA